MAKGILKFVWKNMVTEAYKRELLRKLVEGTINPSEYRQLELTAMDDPFLFEALEGFALNKGNDFTKSMANIHQNVDQYLNKKKRNKPAKLYIAAAVVAGIVFTSIIVLNISKKENSISSKETVAVGPDNYDYMTNTDTNLSMSENVISNNYEKEQKSPVGQAINNYSKSGIDYELENKSTQKTVSSFVKDDIAGVNPLPKISIPDSADALAAINTVVQSPKTTFYVQPSTETMSGVSENNFQLQPQVTKRIISGVVTDTHGEPLIGANVKAGNSGTITDIEGNFVLEITNRDQLLKVNFVGYETNEIALEQNVEKYNVSLKDGLVLDEVVVLGYKTGAERKNMALSSSSITSNKKTKIKDKEADWKKFDTTIYSAIKKELQKMKYSDSFSATIVYKINEKNQVTEILIDNTSDSGLDESVLKILNKTRKKIPPTTKTVYRLEVRINE
jgi:hypothetical protein